MHDQMNQVDARQGWRRPEILLLVMAAAMPLAHISWMTLINNFAIQQANFDGQDMGILQSLREVPGFLSFAVVFLLFLVREQRLALISLCMLGLGVAAAGFFPHLSGLLVTTFIMSVGFHYYETLHQSLAMQWVPQKELARQMGWQLSARSVSAIIAFLFIWVAFNSGWLGFEEVFLVSGLATLVIAILAWSSFPSFKSEHEQQSGLVLEKRYWLYYALVFMGGARRQIFVVFAGFLMVEKFGYGVDEIALLFLANHILNSFLAPLIGNLITRFGEKRILQIEYIGLFLVFTAYGLVEDHRWAAALYVIDHMFFAMAIGQKIYFRKIVDPSHIAATAGVSFTINHIAAVILPVLFGSLWLLAPSWVFFSGATMAVVSLVLASSIPDHAKPGEETIFTRLNFGPAKS